MKKSIRISASILNIRLHPHPPGIYENWIRDLYSLKRMVQLRGDKYGMISSLDNSTINETQIKGIISTFTKLERDGSWFNSELLTEATTEEVSTINLPKYLNPNAANFFFIFDIIKHRLYFQTYSKGKSISTSFVLKLFDRLAQDVYIMKKYNSAAISVVQDKASLDAMFKLERLKSLEIHILKPNSDIWSDSFDTELEEHLAANNSKELQVQYLAENGGTLTPTTEVKKLANVASRNGTVIAQGRNENGEIKMSSQDFPESIIEKYNPDSVSESEAFIRLINNGKNS